MQKTISNLLLCLVVILAAYQSYSAAARPSLVGLPALTAITPNSFAGGINQPVTITGTDLSNVSVAMLGDTPLLNVVVVDAAQVTALVPWSIAAGAYDLTVKSQGAPDAVLPGAVTVGSAQNDWTSNGPFGGDLYGVIVDQLDPARVYVSANRSGVFSSQNSAASWDFSLISQFPDRVQIAYPTVGQPPVMYVKATGQGLVRSLDYGKTWVALPNADGRAFVRPGHPDWVYRGVDTGIPDDPNQGLYKSTNLGDTWEMVIGAVGLGVSAVAFDPDHADLNIIMGSNDGHVYITTDNGLTWSNPVTLTNRIGELYFAPTLYNGKRSLFAIPYNKGWQFNNEDISYQSTDGGLTWTPLQVAPTNDNNNGFVFGLAFHDTIPGLMWAAEGDGYFSEDGGASWNPVGAGLKDTTGFAVVPGASSRQTTTLYAATRHGLYQSTDGGNTWQETDTGIGANLARTIAISPFNLDEAYAATQAKGLLHTYDGGRNWQSLSIPIAGNGVPIATDPFTDGKVFIADGDASWPRAPTLRVSTNHGLTSTQYTLTLPPAYSGKSAGVGAILPDPIIHDRLLAGVCLDDVGLHIYGPGLIYASTDGGATWIQQTTPAGITCISSLVFDPKDPDVVYAGSTGTGLLRSTDRGATWTPLAHQPTSAEFMSIVIDPRDSNSIYLCAFDETSSWNFGFFATNDGGDHWVFINLGGPVWALKMVHVSTNSYWLYAATMNGLRFLRDIPAEGFDRYTTWERSSGIAGEATVDGFNAASDGSRVVYYIGTSGGATSTTTTNNPLLAAPTASKLMPGGVYRRQGAESAPPQVQIPGWQLKNKAGFGNTNNLISALEVFNGQIYAATSNWANAGCRIWRSANGSVWTPVSEYGMGAAYGSTNPAITDLVAFKGQLYASVGWGTNEGQLWRSSNGTTWDKVSGSEWGGGSNRTITVMAIFNNELYAMTNNATTGLQVWRSSTGDSGSWVKEAEGGFGNANNQTVTGAAVFNDRLYLAVSNTVDGMTVWSKASGGAWTQGNTSGFGTTQNANPGGMAVLGGYLYVGVQNTVTGGQLWRTNGAAWSQAVANGFGDLHNTGINGLMTVQNQLFAVTNNTTTGLQVWQSANGTQWIPLNLNGLGKTGNSSGLWSNSSTAYGSTFYMGTMNGVSGGEIWQYVGFPIYLPDISK
jgi:hypothetical protein